MSKNILLGVNVDHVATIRQARGTVYPDPVAAALLAEEAGADYITMHLREDRRHIQDDDVVRLQKEQSTYLNFEIAITNEMINFATKLKPKDCCLVPEKRQELTTEGGLDIIGQKVTVQNAVERLHAAGIRVSLFIDADVEQIQAAADSGAKVVEFHTGHYADADAGEQKVILTKLEQSFVLANDLGLCVNAGHGLTLQNVADIARLPYLQELNIGHAIVARAIMVGFKEAVAEMQTAISAAG